MIKKTIWVVDDDAVYQIIIRKIIKKSEMFSDIAIFPNGYEALIALKNVLVNNEILPDIILLDINMPVMDGWEFMEEIAAVKSQINKHIAIYIVSSSISIEDKYKAKSYLDILGYLSKPVTLDDMIAIASPIK
jgi:CheY-like chemotaxis protein